MKFNHSAHIALWTWLSENPTKGKEDWPGWVENGGSYHGVSGRCFACQSIEDSWGMEGRCDHQCPILWPNDRGCNTHGNTHGSPYMVWKTADSLTTRAEAALQVAQLPVRAGVEII